MDNKIELIVDETAVVPENKKWLWYSFITVFFFVIVSESSAEVASKIGPTVYFYFTAGNVFLCILYKIYDFYTNYRKNGTWWTNHNIIINGKLNTKHLIGFIALACLYTII